MQMGGSKIARLGVLFNANQSADSSSLLFVKVFEFTLSSYRLVKKIHHSVNFDFLSMKHIRILNFFLGYHAATKKEFCTFWISCLHSMRTSIFSFLQ